MYFYIFKTKKSESHKIYTFHKLKNNLESFVFSNIYTEFGVCVFFFTLQEARNHILQMGEI